MQNRGSFRVYYAWTPTSRYLWTTFNRNSVSQRRTWSNVRIFYEPIVIPNRLYESYLLSIRASNIIFFAQKTSCQLYRNFGRENKIARWKRNTLHNVKFMEKEMKVRGIALYDPSSGEQSLISGNKCSFCVEQSLDAFNKL